jgi:cytochrome P450
MIFFATLFVVLLLGLRISKWIRNYIEACNYGLPIILLPVSFNEPLWMVFRPLFAWVEYLPLGLGNWYLYTTMGWPTEDGPRSVQLYGENFVLCSPVDNTIVTCEPDVVNKIWTETRDIWRMPPAQSQLFTFFGQNVSSTHGEDWKRHRKVTNQAFSERTMASIWSEARRQTKSLEHTIEAESERHLGRVRATFDILAMRVLTVIAWGQDADLDVVPAGHMMSLMDSMGFMLKHILLTVVFNSLRAPNFLLPRILQKLKCSVKEVKLYMQELVLAHMQSSSSKPSAGKRPTSLLAAIVSANELEKHGNEGNSRSYLTDSELYGNIFVFNLGGYETTASTLTFALPFLALNPDVQSWVTEEIDAHTTQFRSPSSANLNSESDPDPDGFTEYSEVYPRLLRTRALMYETLRHASPAPLFIRTPLTPVSLTLTTPTGPRSITVKPGTIVGLNQHGAHLSPRWGSNTFSFDPRRFIIVDEQREEKFQIPEAVVHAAWMIGPRMCPAKKFSQVEFAGIMVELLSEWRVELLRNKGESEGEARERVNRVLAEEKYFNVSAHLKRPEVCGVRFVRRGVRGE